MLTTILSLSTVGNAFAKSSDGDGSGSDGGGEKSKTSEHKKDGGSDNGPKTGGIPAPGVPAARLDDKHNKHKDNDRDSGIGPTVPGVPAAQFNGNDNDGTGNTAYNNGNIKKFDTSKSAFRIGGSDGKVVEYMPGFNETFYNSTLPYCFAVQSGSCYDSSTGQVTP